MTTKHIEIQIAGPVASGKSAILASLRQLLEGHGYCVAIPYRGERLNPSEGIEDSAPHEKPNLDETVITIREIVSK